MNPDLIALVLQFAVSLVEKKPGANLAEALLDIWRAADEVYEKQAGQPINQSVIKKETPLLS